ncbi:MAG: glycosyltransferase [Bacteroidetes bacterium SB0662_bin_6]|nr:glycosyltransferase [Bacteroidetes bacterium SB0668_bin_1]MYE05126.1 glycosyltransferase [Bacteroidetes bacterium SB0662_bin_6]
MDVSHSPAATVDRRTDVIDLSVVIVNYNVREFLEQALRSVFRAQADLNMEVFVVDNNSVDGSPAMVHTHFPEVHLIANPDNAGFSAANNQAIRKARGRYVLVLNPDTIVQENTLVTLVRFLDEHPDAGAAGCKILHPDGTFALESRRAFPTPRVAFFRMIGLAALFPRSAVFGRYNMTHLPENETAEVDALSGSCMMLRRAALAEAGLFDEEFFMYGEDIDLCYRIQQARWKIYYTPETEIIHYKGQSTRKGELRYVRLFYGAMLRFTEKHFESRYSKLLALLLRCGILLRAGMSVAAKFGRIAAWPLLDFCMVYASAGILATTYASMLGTRVAPVFFTVVAPVYGLGSVTGIAALGGYRRKNSFRSVPVGILAGLLLVAALSFFVKTIAFSRLVVLLTLPVAVLVCWTARWIRMRRDAEPMHDRHAVLVGPRDEAIRLHNMLARHPRPPFSLKGFITPDDAMPVRNGSDSDTTLVRGLDEETSGDDPGDSVENTNPTWLGRTGQLRDMVRLGMIHDVVFASGALSNRSIFRYIRELHDLNVHIRILADGRDHVIGRASVDDLSMVNLVETEDAFVYAHRSAGRRLLEKGIAAVGLAIHPLLAATARLAGKNSLPARLASKTKKFPDILLGRRALVGYDETTDYRPPPEWNLRPGVFAVVDVVNLPRDAVDELDSAHWFYVRNRTFSLDWDIIVRSLKDVAGIHERIGS